MQGDAPVAYPLLGIAAMNVSMYQAASALNANTQWQELLAENLGCSSIPGYRRVDVSFEAVQAGLRPGASANARYVMPRAIPVTSFAAGSCRHTGVRTDFAIDGAGFFEVQLPDGTTAYTRDGEFQINGQGVLVTKQGYHVMTDSGPVQLDLTNPEPLMVASTGEITQGTDLKGRLKLTEFATPGLLTRVGNSFFVARDPAAQAVPSTTSTVRQNWLENSNATPVAEMMNLMAAMRSFEANQQIIRIQDERMAKTINELTNS